MPYFIPSMNKHLIIQYNCITGSTSVYPICLQNTKYIYMLSQVLSNMNFSLDLPIPYITLHFSLEIPALDI